MRQDPTFTLIVTAAPPATAPAPTVVQSPAARTDRPASAWSRPAQLAACALVGIALVLLAARALGIWPATARPSELEAAVPQRVDLNRAGRAELLQLPGVGPALADAILNHRVHQGPFQSVEELSGISGIGPRTLERLRPWVEVGSQSVVTAALPTEQGPAPAKSGKKVVPTSPIDPNRATPDELRQLPGIGPKLAQRIIDERARGPFRSAEDLRRVSGIGPKTVEKLRPYLAFRDAGE